MALQLQMSWQPTLLSHKRKNGPPIGLKNLGNTCYLNSVLQCLTYTPPLANFCLRNQHSSLCNSASSDAERKRDCPFCILERRIVRSLSVDLTLDAPLKIQNCLRIFSENFRFGRQEDAHEFLRYVIDACHDTCLRLKKLRRNGTNNGDSTTAVKEIFGGALQSQVKCLSCGNDSNKVDEIMDISLDVLHSNSLKEALHKFFQSEVLDGSNKYKCDKCKKLVAARKQMSILQAPNILVIQLKRFEGIFGGKIDKEISFDEVLLLSSFVCKGSQDPRPEYKLFGTIVHSGFSPESGHYYAYIKDAMGKWYCCNDSYVSVSTLQEVLSEKVYILFFSRTNQRPVSLSTAVTSNGIDSYNCNGTEASKKPKTALPLNTVQKKPNAEQSLSKHAGTVSKVDKESSTPTMKFSVVGNCNSKRALASVNGKIVVDKNGSVPLNGTVKNTSHMEKNGTVKNIFHIEKNGTVKNTFHIEKNGTVKNIFHIEKNGKDKSLLTNGNGVHNNNVDSDDGEQPRTSLLMNGNGNADGAAINSVKGDPYGANGAGTNLCKENGANHHELDNGRINRDSEVKGTKRKSVEDSCVLLQQGPESPESVEELKEVLKKEASSVLRSCGWSDEVYCFMQHSKKRIFTELEEKTPCGNELKKKLVSEARSKFLSQIPESLKQDLIQRLQTFSQKK